MNPFRTEHLVSALRIAADRLELAARFADEEDEDTTADLFRTWAEDARRTADSETTP